MIKTLAPEALSEIYQTNGIRVIDARPTAAYNGWRLGSEARGGHIPGAVAFPQSWAAGMHNAVLSKRLASKGLTPDRSIVVYGYDDQDSASLAKRMLVLGPFGPSKP